MECGITYNCTVYLHRRLRGGSREDALGQWTCEDCKALRCWLARKRCYRCGELRMDAPMVIPPRQVGGLGKIKERPPTNCWREAAATLGKSRKAIGPPPGAGVGAHTVRKRDAAAVDMVRALQLLQSVMSARDFSK